jgi:restriction system protein
LPERLDTGEVKKVRLIVDLASLIRRITDAPEMRWGLCMFAPSLLTVPINRRLNSEFGDSGDNLSVPLRHNALASTPAYWGGNYMSAPMNHALSVIRVFHEFPRSTLLVTESGVGASSASSIAIIHNGEVQMTSEEEYSFYSFAETYLQLWRITEYDHEAGLVDDPGVTLIGLISEGALSASSLMIPPWEAIFSLLSRNPEQLFEFSKDPRAFEIFVAESYRRAGYEVELTPRSNDGGIDVIASRSGFGAVKIIDQAKAFSRGRLVSANDVRALMGVLSMTPSASKAVLTTTSGFAKGVYREFSAFCPTRLELRPGDDLIDWLKQLATTD